MAKYFCWWNSVLKETINFSILQTYFKPIATCHIYQITRRDWSMTLSQVIVTVATRRLDENRVSEFSVKNLNGEDQVGCWFKLISQVFDRSRTFCHNKSLYIYFFHLLVWMVSVFFSFYGKTFRHFYTRAAEHMGISNLTGKRLKNVKQSAISDHLLQCNCAINFDDFSILATDCNKFRLLLRKNLLIKRDKPILNRTMKLFPLEVFD